MPTFRKPPRKSRRTRRTVAAQEAVGKVMTSLGQAEGSTLGRLASRWMEVAGSVLGKEMAELAVPAGHRGRTLLLGVEDPVVGQELSFFETALLERTNAFLGENCFDKIKFDLLQRRVPSSGSVPAIAAGTPAARHPGRLGELDELRHGDSAIARSYRACVKYFERQGRNDTEADNGPSRSSQ